MTDPLGLINNSQGISPSAARPKAPVSPGQAGSASFKDSLMKEIEQVNKLQQNAEQAIEDLHSGKRDDVDAVMMAKLHADTAFKMLLQVRNKMMAAYQEVSQIRV